MVNGIGTSNPCGLNKGCGLKFWAGSGVRQTPEEGQRRHIGWNIVNITNKDEDNSPKTLNNKNGN